MPTTPSSRPRPSLVRSLAVKLALLSLVSSLLTVGLVALITGRVLERTLQESAQEQLRVYAKTAAERFDSIKALELDALRGVANHPSLAGPSVTADSRREFLEALVEGGDYAWAGFTDAAGVVRVATGRVLEGADLSQEFWFQQGLTDSYRSIPLEDPMFAKALGTKSQFLAYGLPVHDAAGQLLGVLGVLQYWRFPGGAVPFDVDKTAPVISVYTRPPKKTWVVDSRGTLHYPVAPDTGGMPRGAGRDSLNGRDAVYGFAYNAYKPWPLNLVVRQTAEIVFAPIRELQGRLLQWGFLVSAVLTLPAFLLGQRVERKLRAMATSARLIGGGDPFSMMPEFRSRDQLAETAQSLNRMIESLKVGRPDDSRGT